MKMATFLALHQIFTFQEVHMALGVQTPTRTLKNLLGYYLKQGRILRIRQGLYYTVPLGSKPATYPIDSYLVAGKLTDDAVLAYHTALNYYGKLHSMRHDRTYLTRRKVAKRLIFRNVHYQSVSIPQKITNSSDPNFGIKTIDRMGIKIRITTLERTFVDVLYRPALVGEWEEIWRSLELIEYFDLNEVFAYLQLLNSATTYARVAFFLETHREELYVPEAFLKSLEPHVPKSPHYLDSKDKGPSKFLPRWNLIVPQSIIQRIWEEPDGDF